MMKNIISILLVSVAFFYGGRVDAQLNNSINRHVIIAFDKKVGYYNTFVRDNSEFTKRMIEGIIDASIPLGQLHEGDYVSLVNYGIGNQNTIREFVRPCQWKEQEIVWKDYSFLEQLFEGEWNPLSDGYRERIKDDFSEGFSMQSAAKSHIIHCLYRKNGDKYANRTYLLMVTDDVYQGSDDINKEYEVSKSARKGKFCAAKEDFLNVNMDLARNYALDYLGERILTMDQGYKIILFEVRPSSSFSLNSVIDYPVALGMHRVRGGYVYCFEARPRNDNYEVLKLLLSYRTKEGEYIETPIKADGKNEGFISAASVEGDTMTINIKGWLLKKDTIYGATVLNPYDNLSSSMSQDLSVDVRLDLKEEATVFGIPLSDTYWWFYPHDIRMAAFVWQVILIVLLVVILLGSIAVYIRVRSRFVPKNKDIELNYK